MRSILVLACFQGLESDGTVTPTGREAHPNATPLRHQSWEVVVWHTVSWNKAAIPAHCTAGREDMVPGHVGCNADHSLQGTTSFGVLFFCTPPDFAVEFCMQNGYQLPRNIEDGK